MSVKLYITAIQSNDDGTAVTLFEDYLLQYQDKESILEREDLSDKVFNKICDVEQINKQVSSPF